MPTATLDLTDTIAAKAELSETGYVNVSRDETIRAIRAALKRRSGKSWSVTGGRGTGYGWIHIDAPRRRRTGDMQPTGEKDEYGRDKYELVDTGQPQEFGLITPQDQAELSELLGVGVGRQGVSIADSSNHYREYIARAEGRTPDKYGVQYWD